MTMKVREVMEENPVTIVPSATLAEAASKMKSIDCGVLPVGTPDKLEGIITDRDIVVRAVAAGLDPNTEKVGAHMTNAICYCDAEDTLEEAAAQMREHQVSRLVVQDSAGRMCGVLTFGCILRQDDDIEEIGQVVASAMGSKAA